MTPTDSFITTLDACAARLEELNERYPQLATSASLSGVEQWRSINPSGEAPAAREAAADDGVRALAIDLLRQHHGLEDVLDILLAEHQVETTLPELVELIGNEVYIAALRDEARQLTGNAISFEQIARLWNDLDRPALGAPRWTSGAVSILAG